MTGYQSILMQKEVVTGNLTPAVMDIKESFGIYCKMFPFKLFGDAKELPVRNRIDKNGADEYTPPTLMLDAYDLEVEFAYKGNKDSANEPIKSFLNYLIGKNTLGANLRIYDPFTMIGRRHVRYKSVNPDMFIRNTSEGDVITFGVVFRVNDPVTDVVPSVVEDVVQNLIDVTT